MRVCIKKSNGKNLVVLAQHILGGCVSPSGSGDGFLSAVWTGNPTVVFATGSFPTLVQDDIDQLFTKINLHCPDLVPFMGTEGHRFFARRQDVTAYEEDEDGNTLLTFLPGSSPKSSPHTVLVVETLEEITEILDGTPALKLIPGMGGPVVTQEKENEDGHDTAET